MLKKHITLALLFTDISNLEIKPEGEVELVFPKINFPDAW